MNELVQELKRTIGRKLQKQGLFGVEVILEWPPGPVFDGLVFELRCPESFSEEQKRRAGEIASPMVREFLTAYGKPRSESCCEGSQ